MIGYEHHYRDDPDVEAHVNAFLQTWEATHVSQCLTEVEAEHSNDHRHWSGESNHNVIVGNQMRDFDKTSVIETWSAIIIMTVIDRTMITIHREEEEEEYHRNDRYTN